MTCDCASLRAEIISQRSEINSQRRLMINLFKLMMTEFQEVKKQNSDIISTFNEFKINLHDATTAQPSILESSVSKPFSASLILEKNLGSSETFEPLSENPNQFGMSAELFEDQKTFEVAESSSQKLSTTIGPNAKDADEGIGTISPNMDHHSLPIMGGGISFEIVPKTESEAGASSESFPNQPTIKKSKLYRCSECAYETNTQNSIVRHKRIHTGERPFACDQCPFRATQKSILIIHRRTHTGEKPFKCDQCPYSSAQKANLKMHKMTHTGEKPYQCEFCDYRNACKKNMEYHRTHKH